MDIRKPARVTHTYTQTLAGTRSEVFPLLCPVLETEWCSGWHPRLVVSHSGVAERDCVFITPDAAAGVNAEAIWTITEHDPSAGTTEMLKVTPGFLVIRLSIAVRDAGSDRCLADVTYRYTALSPAGEEFVSSMTESAYLAFMREWEDELNAYLERARMGAAAGASPTATHTSSR